MLSRENSFILRKITIWLETKAIKIRGKEKNADTCKYLRVD